MPSSTGGGGIAFDDEYFRPRQMRRSHAAFQNPQQRRIFATKDQNESEIARVQNRRLLVGQNRQIAISEAAATLAELGGQRSYQFG
jgi:hypothetical protein